MALIYLASNISFSRDTFGKFFYRKIYFAFVQQFFSAKHPASFQAPLRLFISISLNRMISPLSACSVKCSGVYDESIAFHAIAVNRMRFTIAQMQIAFLIVHLLLKNARIRNRLAVVSANGTVIQIILVA